MRNSKYILTWYNRDMLKEDLIWQCNMTNNLNLMQSGIIKIIKISGVCQVKCVSSFLHLFPQLSAV